MNWKFNIMMVFCILISFSMFGCGEEFVAGFGSGVTIMETMADDAQNKFLTAVNALNEETSRINDIVNETEGTVLVKPKTLEAIQGLKGREKDPVTWIALASLLANAFFGGKSYVGKGK